MELSQIHEKQVCSNPENPENQKKIGCMNKGVCFEEVSSLFNPKQKNTGTQSCTCPSGYTGEFCENKVPFSTSETCKTPTSTSFSYDSYRPCYISNIATIAIFATVFALVLLRRPQKYQAAASLHARSRRASMSKCTSQTSLGERHESLASLIDFGRNNPLPVLHGGGSIAGGGRGSVYRKNENFFEEGCVWIVYSALGETLVN